ncbi:MAG: 2-oxoacid:ferredoxin oxidoreductase subunit beta, partial [Planctomycetaceae bacterium]|nr:2-oxoacid:ferredoxin oxidoreductase subunit beta [Planctomycetaceae bacterium]
LTKGQYSPTSPAGKKTKSTPYGSVDNPVSPLSVALGCEASFVARSVDVDIKHLAETLKRAAEHRGTSFVEVYQDCNVFNTGAFDYAADKSTRADNVIYLEHGKPLRFGKNNEKGVRLLPGGRPEVVTLGNGVTEDDLLFHDETADNAGHAFLLTQMRHPEFPEPMGVFRAVQRPIYNEAVENQMADALSRLGEGNLEDLLAEGDTWTVK